MGRIVKREGGVPAEHDPFFGCRITGSLDDRSEAKQRAVKILGSYGECERQRERFGFLKYRLHMRRREFLAHPIHPRSRLACGDSGLTKIATSSEKQPITEADEDDRVKGRLRRFVADEHPKGKRLRYFFFRRELGCCLLVVSDRAAI